MYSAASKWYYFYIEIYIKPQGISRNAFTLYVKNKRKAGDRYDEKNVGGSA